MSTTLPSRSGSSELDLETNSSGSFDLVGILLRDQESMTAVERFGKHHDVAHSPRSDQHAVDFAKPAQSRYYQALLPATAPSADQQFAFEVDLDSCSGCKACVVACHTLNGLEDDESWRRVGTLTLGNDDDVQSIAIQHVTTACHHCADPGCLNGCPVKAYVKDEVTGIVRHLDDQCIGCKYCTMMCPYEVPRYSDRLGIVRKCDMCHQRLATNEAPACVQACPNEAIRISLVQRLAEPISERLVAGAPLSAISQPSTVYRTANSSALAHAHDDCVDHVAESHWPLAALMIGTQVSVGMLTIECLLIMVGSSGFETTRWVATVAFLIAALGLNLAPLHLGQPLRAWRVFLGLRTSWLSREAVVLGQYMACLGIAVGLAWMPVGLQYVPESVANLIPTFDSSFFASLAVFASVPMGIAGLFCSGMIYVATGRPLWRFSATMLTCAGTTLIGGVVGVIAVDSITALVLSSSTMSGAVRASLVFVLVLGMLAKLVWESMTIWGRSRSADQPLQARRRRLIDRDLRSLRSFRVAMGGGAAVMAGVSFFVPQSANGSPLLMSVCVITLAMVLLGEFCERLLYFKSVVFDRMPGTLR